MPQTRASFHREVGKNSTGTHWRSLLPFLCPSHWALAPPATFLSRARLPPPDPRNWPPAQLPGQSAAWAPFSPSAGGLLPPLWPQSNEVPHPLAHHSCSLFFIVTHPARCVHVTRLPFLEPKFPNGRRCSTILPVSRTVPGTWLVHSKALFNKLMTLSDRN